MKRRILCATTLLILAVAYTPNCKAVGHRGVKRPADNSVSLELRFMKKKANPPRNPKESQPPKRPSHDRVLENLDRWVNSPGLQPPK